MLKLLNEWIKKKFWTELCLFKKCSIMVSCGETLIANIPSKPNTKKVQTKNILKDQMWTITFDNQQLQYITLHTVIDYSNKINYLPVAIQRHKNSKDWYFQLIWNWKTNPNDNIWNLLRIEKFKLLFYTRIYKTNFKWNFRLVHKITTKKESSEILNRKHKTVLVGCFSHFCTWHLHNCIWSKHRKLQSSFFLD